MYREPISRLCAALASQEVSSEALVSIYLDRVQTFEPRLNSFITVTDQLAHAQAQTADSRIRAGAHAPLVGIPIAHKDIFCTEGIKTSCGSRMLDNFVSPYSATVVERIEEAGMVTLGKTNMDEFAMGSSNENSFYGPVCNPWDATRVPGGSSGGSAAAVAARLVPIATGTDTGGSIRQPAALCGVTGLKPTYGRVSRYGMVAFASSLDQGGLIAVSAEDIAWVLDAAAGFDTRDSTSIDHPVDDYVGALENDLRGLRIGVAKEHFGEGLDADVAQTVEDAIHRFERLGAMVSEISLPNTDLAIPTYYVVAPAECSSNLSRFDGIRFGYRAQNPLDLEDLYKRSRGEGFGPEVKRRIMIGTYALSAGYYDAYYLKAQRLRRLISEDFQRVFSEVDVIMGPTTPSVAFKLGERSDDPVSMYLCDIYTTAVNLAGLPAISVPAGFVAGLPVGLQVIGNYFEEARLLSVAHQYQQVTDWHRHMPPGFE